MMNDPNHLIPTSIVDRNGKQPTVHKKLMPGSGAGASSIPAPGASTSKPATEVDWNRTSTEDAIALAKNAAQTLSDPDRVWDNFKFYTGMLNSQHHVEARALCDKDNVLASLRGAWLDKHGMVLDVDRDKYSRLKGKDGYNAFTKARDKMLDAHRKPDPTKNKQSASKDDSGAPRGLNPFSALRGRKERKDREDTQRWNVRIALDGVAPLGSDNDWTDDIIKRLNKPELVAKASELTDIVLRDNDDDTTRNFARGLQLDDSNHTVLNAMYAHKNYIAEVPGHLGILVETARYLKNKGWDSQQEDGTMPHLEGYVEALTKDMKERMLMLGETEIENIPLKPYLDRAIRSYNQQRVNSV